MKKIIILVFVGVSILQDSFCQKCDLETLLNQPGHWITAKPNPVSGVEASDLARQKAIINKIVLPVQQKYSPKGVDVQVSNANFRSGRLPANISSGNYYAVDWVLAEHDCPYNRSLIDKKLSGAYGIYVIRLHINDFAFLFGRTFFVPNQLNKEDLGTEVFALVDDKPVKDGAGWYWKSAGGTTGTDQHYWLITKDEKLPFVYISRKEFAERLKVYYQQKIKAAESDYANNMKIVEETFANAKKINAAEAEKYKEQSIIQYKKYFEIENSQYSKNIIVVDKILAGNNDLNEPAIIDRNNEFFDFTGFVEADHIYSSYIIKPDPGYFNSKLPKSSPQFMALYYPVSIGPAFKTALAEILKAIDIARLKEMLEK